MRAFFHYEKPLSWSNTKSAASANTQGLRAILAGAVSLVVMMVVMAVVRSRRL
jgi:hypothetical protein